MNTITQNNFLDDEIMKVDDVTSASLDTYPFLYHLISNTD
jgi:hypothetical protein